MKKARKQAGLTQEAAAGKLQVSRQTLSNWENNRTYPDLVSLLAISDLYQISLDALLKGDQDLVQHMEDKMDTVKQGKQLTAALLINLLLLVIGAVVLRYASSQAAYIILFVSLVVSVSFLLMQIVKRI
ncbi:helix-turn-helix transcriptional regulator [Lactobacillus sp.]|uniref:helix-turn-helix transcriptional regulator n=1 Tax=Lactobacillus sp. TaxID=1591 RepID=UPI003F0140F6